MTKTDRKKELKKPETDLDKNNFLLALMQAVRKHPCFLKSLTFLSTYLVRNRTQLGFHSHFVFKVVYTLIARIRVATTDVGQATQHNSLYICNLARIT